MPKAIKSVVMSGAGQGDVVMAVAGLHALYLLKPEAFAQHAVCKTRSVVEPIARILLPELTILPTNATTRLAHPRYFTSSKTSLSTLWRNVFAQDWFVNFAQRRRLASYGYRHPSWWARQLQMWSDLALLGSFNWRHDVPSYYGHKMWLPLAFAHRLSAIDLMRGLYQSYPILSQRIADYAQSLPPFAVDADIAVFPTGQSFQTLSPEFVANLNKTLLQKRLVCFFAPGDPLLPRYAEQGIRCQVTSSIDDVLACLRDVAVVVTVDSFVAHLAQFYSRYHIAVMSHDLPVHTVHPASKSQVIFEALPCVPCEYRMRRTSQVCAAGKEYCGVYQRPSYLANLLYAIEHAQPLPRG